MAHIFGSIWDRFNRNALNDLSKSVEVQGKSIQELVAEGQLTPEQYAELVSIVNGNVKKGDITTADIDKNNFAVDQTMISDSLRQMIAGDAPINAVPAKYSITTDKLAFTPLEGKPSKNLFNKNTVETGKYLRSDDGLTLNSSTYFASDFIRVKPSTMYAVNPVDDMTRINFYGESFDFISSVDNSATPIMPENAFYVRLSNRLISLNQTQFEEGSSPTSYTEYGALFDPTKIRDNTLDGRMFKAKSIGKEKLDFVPLEGVQSKNLFDESKILPDTYLRTDSGLALPYSGVFTSDFILVEPNTVYNTNAIGSQLTITFYTSEKEYTGQHTKENSFTTPNDALFLRFYASNVNLGGTTQLEKGDSFTGYSPYGVELSPETLKSIGVQRKNKYTFNDAWINWLSGKKFPIAFFGDSTVDGVGTSGNIPNTLGTDNLSPNAFPFKLEQLLRGATNNQTLRIYNAGFSSRDAGWGLSNMDAEFGEGTAYEDTKMLGIGFGINDRNRHTDVEGYRNNFKMQIRAIIEWCYERNIQPFLITTQAALSPGRTSTYEDGVYPMRTAMHIETIANEVKRELAEEDGLELIDINKYTEKFLLYSNHPAKTIISDRLHFGNVGHQYEADLIYSHIVPHTNIVNGFAKIDYSSQKLASGIPEDLLTIPETPTDQFKVYANYTKEDTIDTNIMTVHVFNSAKKQLTLNAYKSIGESLTYVKVNGVTATLEGLENTVGTLELGLHKLEVFTGDSNVVDFKGFIIE